MTRRQLRASRPRGAADAGDAGVRLAHRRLHELGRVAGDQCARTEHGLERGTSRPSRRLSRDRARGNISLLRSEAALLDRERGRISGRPYVIQALDLHPVVGRQESVLALRQSWQRRDLETRQRDHPVEPERSRRRPGELVAVEALGSARDPQRDRPPRRASRQRAVRRGTEEPSGDGSCVTSGDLDAAIRRASRSAAVSKASS